MHRLILFDGASAISTDDWRLKPAEVRDISDSVDLLARCRARLVEVETVCRAQMEEARARGFLEGLAEGQATARRETAAQLNDFFANLSVDQARRRGAVGRLAMEIVRQLLGDLDAERAIELFVVRRLQDLKDEEPLELRVGGGRGPGVERQLRDRGVGLRVVEDLSLAPDECAFEFASGRAHARLCLQLAALDAMIAEVEAGLAQGDRDVV